MHMDVKGIESLLRKLQNLENVNFQQEIQQIGEEVIRDMQSIIPRDTGKSAESIGIDSVISYRLSFMMKIGLSSKTAPFNDWKGAWYNQWGFHNWGRGGMYKGTFVQSHIGWFTEYKANVSNQVKETIKFHLQAKIREILNS